MDFSEALREIKEGKKVARAGWDLETHIFLIKNGLFDFQPDIFENCRNCKSKGIEPFICMCRSDGKHIPWMADQEDILAYDWIVVE